MQKKPKKAPARRAKAKRPSIQFRVSQEIHERLAERADKIGVPLSEVAARWIEDFDARINAEEDARKLLHDAQTLIRKDLENYLLAKGYTKLPGVNGNAWLEPHLKPTDVAFWTEPTAFQKAQEEAVRKVFGEIIRAGKGDSK